MADVRDALVPVTLYVPVDGGNFLEDVLWNPLDGRDAMASFALGFCRDVGLPTTQVPALVSQIARQVGSWLEQAQRANRSADAPAAKAPAAPAPKDVREVAYECWLGDSRYRDRVLWDVADPHASPEDFAAATVRDLGLPNECALPIAVALRKQVCAETERAAGEEREGREGLLDMRTNRPRACLPTRCDGLSTRPALPAAGGPRRRRGRASPRGRRTAPRLRGRKGERTCPAAPTLPSRVVALRLCRSVARLAFRLSLAPPPFLPPSSPSPPHPHPDLGPEGALDEEERGTSRCRRGASLRRRGRPVGSIAASRAVRGSGRGARE